MAHMDPFRPFHPGEIFCEEFLYPLGVSAHQLAMALGAPSTCATDVVITADIARTVQRN